MYRAVAQHDFQAGDATQISVPAGEQVTVVAKGENGWWRVRRDNGQEGFASGAFFKELDVTVPPSPPTAPAAAAYVPPPYQPPPMVVTGAPVGVSNVVVVTPVAAIPLSSAVNPWPHHPMTCICQYCGSSITTATRKTMGTLAWLICLVVCLFVGIFSLIVLCIDDLKDTSHYCPACDRFLGRRDRG